MSHTRTHVLIRLDGEWSRVGHAGIETDDATGMRLLRIELSATAPVLYISLSDIPILESSLPVTAEHLSADGLIGHA
jgi:hypothetical protein